ncbi:MAG: glycosyltransferase family 9 protein [Planctomycetota bacterium]
MAATDRTRRVLIIRPSALGDVCRSVPLAASIRAAWPGARIEWLVNAPSADAIRAHPAVDEAVAFHRRGTPAAHAAFLRELRGRRYSAVIDAQGLARSGVFSLATCAPIRIARRDAREGAWLAANRRVRGSDPRHTVDVMLSLLGPLGIEPVHDLRLTAPNDARAAIAEDPAAGGVPVVLAPTSLWPGKRWPIERFAELARRLLPDRPVIAVGGPDEADQCGPLLAVPGVIDRVGRTSVGGLMALIERAGLVVANDSAALHMAVGFGRPIVALFGPTRIELVGPYRRDEDVIQHLRPGDTPDHKTEANGRALMERITVDEVEAAARDRLG